MFRDGGPKLRPVMVVCPPDVGRLDMVRINGGRYEKRRLPVSPVLSPPMARYAFNSVPAVSTIPVIG
jgi:hypothetical protein